MTLSPKISAKTTLTALFGILIIGAGLTLVFAPATTPVATTIYPQAKKSPAASPAPSSASGSVAPSTSSSPTVAGASTSRPQPASRSSSAAAVAAAPASTPSDHVQLILFNKLTGTYEYSIQYAPGMTACTILGEAKNEGEITSVSTTFGGAFVNEINGYINHTAYGGAFYNWTFERNGTYSNVGCSQVKLVPNDSVKWSFSDAHQN